MMLPGDPGPSVVQTSVQGCKLMGADIEISRSMGNGAAPNTIIETITVKN